MVKTFRTAALSASVLAVAMFGLVSLSGPAGAQAAAPDPSAPKQVALTQPQIDDLIASQKDIRAVASAGPQDKPDAATEAKFEAAVKKHGFDGSSQFADVSYSVGLVMAGIDPETKQFVGPGALIGKQIKEVEADPKMPPADKKEALAELNGALQQGTSDTPSPGNIDLVKANFAKLSAAIQQQD